MIEALSLARARWSKVASIAARWSRRKASGAMTYVNVVLLALGILLLAAVLNQVDLHVLGAQISRVGGLGFSAIMVVYALGFSADVLSWQVVVRSVSTSGTWFRRLFLIRAIGEAYNNIVPSASMAGEPIKIWLLKHNHGISYADSSTSLMLSKTASMIALTTFAGAALMTAFVVQDLTAQQKLYSATLFVVLLGAISIFVLLQRAAVLSALATRISKVRIGRKLLPFVEDLHRFDVGMQAFYIEEKRLLGLSFIFATLGWLVGVVEIMLIFWLLGQPVSWTDALLIEAALQLVRTLAFVVPAGLGAQEAAMFVVAGAIMGDPGTGIAAALVRRCRELAWVVASLGIGLMRRGMIQ